MVESSIERRVRSAGAHLNAELPELRTGAERFVARVERRKSVRTAALAGTSLLGAVAIVLALRSQAPEAGARVTPPAERTVPAGTPETASQVQAPRALSTPRTFEVHSGDVAVEVAGTAFAQPAVAPSATKARGQWRTLARSGRYDRAFTALNQEGGVAGVRDVAADLLMAADVARLSGHPEQAIAPLARIMNRHSNDSRAALAAFTLGRVYLTQLNRPHDAAVAFMAVRRLDSRSPLVEDALVREVEARKRAGQTDAAARAAAEYLQRFPQGRRAGELRAR